MTMRVSFEISDKDLSHFRECMQKARAAVKDAEESEIVEAAREMFVEIHDANAPSFVNERLHRLEAMIKMVQDEEWALAGLLRERVLCALVYFCDPDDLIPDSIPGLGYLDDAIMIELVFRELRHEIEAYDDFVEWRTPSPQPYTTAKAPAATDKRLASKRETLLQRVARRKQKDEEAKATGKAPELF